MRILLAYFLAFIPIVPSIAADKVNATLLSATEVTTDELQAARRDGRNTIVLMLNSTTPEERDRELVAAKDISSAGFKLSYWIEIARCPEIADAHPEWMASLQGHPEWRRFYPDLRPTDGDNEVIKNYPWVPILYEESFVAHRERVARLLKDLPAAESILLHGLQGAPSACGCGNSLCRWTADYGPLKTATMIEKDAAAKFIASIKELVPTSRVIPVWLTECEEHDCERDGLCAGVGCFDGLCWRAWTEQLMPVAEQSTQIAVFAPFREFQRDLPMYGGQAAWVSHALKSFTTMPPQRGGTAINSDRLIAVIQGWDVTDEELLVQQRLVEDSSAAGCIVMKSRINQDWSPKMFKLRPANKQLDPEAER